MTASYERYAKVIKIIDEHTIVINRGSDDGISVGDKFLIFGLGDNLSDPDTGEDLGVLELVKGRARVTHAQPRMATLVSNEYEVVGASKRIIRRRSGVVSWTLGPEVEEVEEPGERNMLPITAEMGDLGRPV